MAERRREGLQNTNRTVEKTHTYTRNAGVRGIKSQSSLERKLNSYFKSNHRNGIDAGRLELYWKQICEQENNSKKRNKSLMEDFERIEQQVSLLDAKTRKLKDLKDQYQLYISKMYPRWLEELKHHRQRLQQERNNLEIEASRNRPQRTEGLLQSKEHLQPREYIRERGSGHSYPNHVRFASPEQYNSLYQFQNSSLCDSQPTSYQDQSSYYDQSSTQDPTRYRTMDWDPYHRESSFDYYHFGRVSSLRTPQGHFHQQPGDFMRFSTPYHPGHSGPLDPRYGFNHSLDLSSSHVGYERGPRPRHPGYMGSPIMYQSPGRPLYNENIRPAMPRQGAINPESGVPHSTNYEATAGENQERHMNQQCLDNTMNQTSPSSREQSMSLGQSECNGSTYSAPTSPYARDPAEKPLELTTQVSHHHRDKEPVKSVPAVKRGSKSTSRLQDCSDDVDSYLVPSNEYPETSPLDLNDLQPDSAMLDQVKLSTEQIDKEELDVSKDRETDDQDNPPEVSEGSLSLSIEDTSISDRDLPDEDETIGKTSLSGKPQVDQDEDLTTKPSTVGTIEKSNLPQEDDSKEVTRKLSIPEKPHELPQTDHSDNVPQEAHEVPEKHLSVRDDSGDKMSNKIDLNQAKSCEMEEQEKKPSKTKETSHIKEHQSKVDASHESVDSNTSVAVSKTSHVNQDKLPSVTIKVLLTLLRAVEADAEVSFSPETLYRAPQCSQAMKEDIIRTAENDDNTLDAYDPGSISMIVLEELPLLVRASASHCLVQDQVLLSEEAYSTPKQLRAVIEPGLVPLWDSLLSHMTKLVKHNVLAVDEAASIFGHLLLKQDSECQLQFQTLLVNLIKGIVIGGHDIVDSLNQSSEFPQKDENHSVTSDESSTLGSTPPVYDKEAATKEQPLDVPTHTLQRTLSYEDDFEEDDVPLNETPAYRKMMSSAQSTVDELSDSQGKPDPKGEESEGDDDLERTLARSISPPPTSPKSPRQQSSVNNMTPEKKKPGKQKPKLSLFGGGAGSLGLSYGSEDLGNSWGGDDSAKFTSSWKSNVTDNTASAVSDEDVSPLSSPDLDHEPAYIPSAMDSGHKKESVQTTAKSSAKLTRKQEFLNHSDTESEVDLHLSTGAADDEDDDFDFYG